MNPKYNFSILMGDEMNVQCTVTNPESLCDVINGSLVITKDGSLLQGQMRKKTLKYNNMSTSRIPITKF